MSNYERYYKFAYRRADDESQVHWHFETPPALLQEAVMFPGTKRTALDIGCGTGVNAVFMAQHGFKVTAIDIVPEALSFAGKRANRFGANIEFVCADILKFETDNKYDLILDSGCFHGFNDSTRTKYRSKLLSLISQPDSPGKRPEYILLHFGKRRFSSYDLFGPRKKTKDEIARFFQPELALVDFRPETRGKPLYQYRFESVATVSRIQDVAG